MAVGRLDKRRGQRERSRPWRVRDFAGQWWWWELMVRWIVGAGGCIVFRESAPGQVEPKGGQRWVGTLAENRTLPIHCTLLLELAAAARAHGRRQAGQALGSPAL